MYNSWAADAGLSVVYMVCVDTIHRVYGVLVRILAAAFVCLYRDSPCKRGYIPLVFSIMRFNKIDKVFAKFPAIENFTSKVGYPLIYPCYTNYKSISTIKLHSCQVSHWGYSIVRRYANK